LSPSIKVIHPGPIGWLEQPAMVNAISTPMRRFMSAPFVRRSLQTAFNVAPATSG
jgi:hypothetical protein